MTVSDLDIYRTANVLVREHGDEAPIHAAMKNDAFLEAGDLDGCAMWKRIIPGNRETTVEGTAAGGCALGGCLL